ncbi:response regulator [Massilia sp. TS11]|uniref:response regulator n=1 Tax=Massilia sp. TS11 TaxID=2908003 RepID=UPI001EDB10CD|nr:response regulator [Massilia sp. TS11]MCG2583174.1 response regulator [Massilia sp. TS11]
MGILSGKRVLVVDDQEHVRLAVTQLLRERSFDTGEIRSVSRVQSALDELTRGRYDLIITEAQMEPLSGMDLLQKVRSGATVARHDLPVVLLALQADPNIVKRALELHADGFVVKPVRLGQLESRLTEAIFRPKPKLAPEAYAVRQDDLAPRRPETLKAE